MGRRLRLAISFSSFRFVSQAFALVTGILILRVLSKDQYALYSIASNIVIAVGTIASAGVPSLYLARASRYRRLDLFPRAETLLTAAITVRRRTTLVLLVPSVLISALLSLLNGAGVVLTIAICLLIVASVLPVMEREMRMVRAQAEFEFSEIRRADLGGQIARSAAVLIAIAGNLASLLSMLTASVIGAVVELVLYRRRNSSEHPARHADLRVFKRSVLQTMPAAMLLILGQQLILLVLSVVGNTHGIAEVAALGRFAAIFTLPTALAANLIAPEIARRAPTKAALRWPAAALIGVYAASGVVYVGVITAFSHLFLSILGPSYSGLEQELVVLAAGEVLGQLGYNALRVFADARGWLKWSWTYAPFLALWLVVSLLFLPLSTSLGAAQFAAMLPACVLLSSGIRFAAGYVRLRTK